MHPFALLQLLGVLLVLLILLAIAARLIRRLGQERISQGVPGSYVAIRELLTPAERSFFGVLQQAVSRDYQIFAKVRLADIIRPARNPSRSAWQSAFNRITGKHVDFVICDSLRLTVHAVIELDDKTHERFERGVRDSLVNAALESARIPVMRVKAQQSYSPSQMRSAIEDLFRTHQNTAKGLA